jgi:hypothetical protein
MKRQGKTKLGKWPMESHGARAGAKPGAPTHPAERSPPMANASHPALYDASVPVFSAMLANLSHCLAKGEENAKERNIDPQVFLNSRLAPDMFALTRQVQIATDHAKGAPFRLAGRDVPSLADNEASFADLHARIQAVREMLKEFKPAEFEGAETRDVVVKTRMRELNFKGLQYLHHYALPNFYFHMTTAYAILRHNGVPIGKLDFLGGR